MRKELYVLNKTNYIDETSADGMGATILAQFI